MFFENYYINFSEKNNINLISSYQMLMTKFVNTYIKIYYSQYEQNNKLYEDALIYSKYYLYYRTMSCVYVIEVMEILFNIDRNILSIR